LKNLHDLLVLRIIQEDKEKKTFPLAQIVGRTGIKWDPEFPVDKGWIDIYVPIQKGIEHPYAIEVQTGYDFNCAGILQNSNDLRMLSQQSTIIRSLLLEVAVWQLHHRQYNQNYALSSQRILLNSFHSSNPKRFLYFFGKERLNGNVRSVKKLL